MEGFSELVSGFIEANRNFFLVFSTKRQPDIVKTISANTENVDLILRTLKNNVRPVKLYFKLKKCRTRDNIPFKNTVFSLTHSLTSCSAPFISIEGSSVRLGYSRNIPHSVLLVLVLGN